MNTPSDRDATTYVADVLLLYVELPETPLRTGVQDQWRARRWHDLGVSLRVVESAFLLGSLRRLLRPADAPPLATVRSLAYFQPVIDEVQELKVSDDYFQHLRRRLDRLP